MFWNEQAEALTSAFTETQSKIWQSWYELMRTVPAPMTPFSAGPFSAGMDQWREFTSKGVRDWTTESEQVVKDVAQRLHVAQDTAMRFLELSLTAWKAMTPKVAV